MTSSFGRALREIAEVATHIEQYLAPDRLSELASRLDVDAGLMPGLSLSGLASAVARLRPALETLAGDGDISPAQALELCGQIAAVGVELKRAGDAAGQAELARLAQAILDQVIAEQLERRHPFVFSVLKATGFVEIVDRGIASSGLRKRAYSIHWQQLGAVLQAPLETLTKNLGWDESSDATTQRLLDLLDEMAVGLRLPASRGALDAETLALVLGVQKARLTEQLEGVTVPLARYSDPVAGYTQLELVLVPLCGSLVDAGEPQIALITRASGATNTEFRLSPSTALRLSGSLSGGCGLVLQEGAIRQLTAAGGESSGIGIELSRETSAEEKVLDIGVASLLLKKLGLAIALAPSKEFEARLWWLGRLIIGVSEGDGLLARLFGDQRVEVALDDELVYSRSAGLRFKGRSGLRVQRAVDLDVGPVKLREMSIEVAAADTGLEASVGLTCSGAIGPVTFNIENVGVSAHLGARGKDNNAGLFDVHMGFKPPSAVGLSLESSAVKGGGFLRGSEGNYDGILQLSVQDRFSITAIGILTTKTPEGADTFSLKLFGMAEFSPIQLGFGFSISGLGLAIAIECAMDEDAIRKAVYEGSLRSLLFPPDPIANASRIIDDLKAFFPPREGSFVIGAMAKLGWGAGTPLIKADVGIFLEVGSSVRLALAGIAYAILPNERSPILVLNVQLLGLLDFNKGTLAIDSSLSGSKLLDWTLDGDVALRSSWGDAPRFVFSSGGFYPGYQPPADFPALDRLSLTIGSGNPRIVLFSYFAITENSVQAGAELLFHWGKHYNLPWPLPDVDIEVDGGTGFNAILKFNPFSFETGFFGYFGLRCNGDELMSVRMDATLSGPNRYHLVGSFEFEVFGYGIEVHVDEWFGRKAPEVTPEPVDPVGILKGELDKNENWVIASGEARGGVVLWNEPAGPELIADPFARTGFNQHVMPLATPIQKIGQVDAQDGAYDVVVDGSFTSSRVDSSFAMGEFLLLNDADKLSCPPFQRAKSGLELEAGASPVSEKDFVERDMCFEVIDLEQKGRTRSRQPLPIPRSDVIRGVTDLAGRLLYVDRRPLPGQPAASEGSSKERRFRIIEDGLAEPHGVARVPDRSMSYAEAHAWLRQRRKEGRAEGLLMVDESLIDSEGGASTDG